jgi:hypothetical protein
MPAKSPRSTTAILTSVATLEACAESARCISCLKYYSWLCSSSGEDCDADGIRLFKAREVDLCGVMYGQKVYPRCYEIWPLPPTCRADRHIPCIRYIHPMYVQLNSQNRQTTQLHMPKGFSPWLSVIGAMPLSDGRSYLHRAKKDKGRKPKEQ